ncbi:Rha family transcriptional regulator [Glutamicibacter sp. TV12E]|uniref:Rha family transcriptional regulator n=1 Tax=Glutamicibacter sp. TV12E TaxID=3446362 RepID=UPI004034B917
MTIQGLPQTPEQAESEARALLPVIETSTNGLVVSSEQIARGADVEHRAVLQMITKHQLKIERFGTLAFEMRKSGGQPTRIALLNEQQATLLMSFMRNTDQVIDFKVNMVDAFFAMAEQLKTQQFDPANLSRIDILQLAMAAEQENQALRAQAELDAPKVGYFDSMVADNDFHLLRSVASNLAVGERDLRLALKYAGWIYSDSYRRRTSKGEIVTEYQWSEYADKKPYFHRVMNHDAPLFKGNVPYTLKVTTAGAAAITRLVARLNAKYGSLKEALPALEIEYKQRKTKNTEQNAAESSGLW